MSNKVNENIHLLQTLSDKNLPISARQYLVKALPKNAFVVLREIFFNVAIGGIKGFPPKITGQLRKNRLLVFKLVDENQNLSDLERQKLVQSTEVIDFLATVLPSILKVILSKEWCREHSDDEVSESSFEIKVDDEDDDE